MAAITISSFQELTGLGRSAVVFLLQRHFQGVPIPDFYLAIYLQGFLRQNHRREECPDFCSDSPHWY